MLWPLTAAASALVGRRSALGSFEAFYEVPSAAGIPDLLLVRFDEMALEARRAAGLEPVVGAAPALVLWLVMQRPLAAGALAEAAGMTAGHVRRSVLPELAAIGVVEERADGCWAVPPAMRQLTTAVVAVEAKRSDWKGALAQARRYSRFASSTYIALDRQRAAPALSWADDIVSGGIGLATVDASDESVRVWRRPRWQARKGWESLLMGERLWELARSGVRRGPAFSVFGRPAPITPDCGARSQDSKPAQTERCLGWSSPVGALAGETP